MGGGFSSIAQEPLGVGLGSAGLAARVNTGTVAGSGGKVGDAGWFQIILIYGLPGTGFLLAAMLSGWRLLGQRFRVPTLRDDHVLLARAMMITLIPTCFVGDLLTGFSIFWLALGCGISIPPRLSRPLTTERPALGGPAGRAQGPGISEPVGPDSAVEPTIEATADDDSSASPESRGFWLRNGQEE